MEVRFTNGKTISFSKDSSDAIENTKKMEECCDALVHNRLLTIEDFVCEDGVHSYIFSKSSMVYFFLYAYIIKIPFDMDYILHRYNQFITGILAEESRQVAEGRITKELKEKQHNQ